MTFSRLFAAAAAVSFLIAAPPAVAFGPEQIEDLKLGLSLADMEQVGQESLGTAGEIERNALGDPELSFPTTCSDKGRVCASADVDFTATALGEEAYMLTVRTRFAKPPSLSRVLAPLTKRYGREAKRIAQKVGDKGKDIRQVVQVLWGEAPVRPDALESLSGKIDLLARGTSRTAALMSLDVADGKVLSYTLMVMDRERYARNRAFHDGEAAAAAPALPAQVVNSDFSVAR
jgi:hypothetical protein